MDRAEFIASVTAFERRLLANIKDVYCPVHLALGAEDVAADIRENIDPADWLYTHHRCHGYALAKGVPEHAIWDEIMGLESGLNGGFSGSQSMTSEAHQFFASAIVGGFIGVATGTALALKLDRSAQAVVCVFGDAGTEQGVCWESFNFAALHKLPIAYICENNGMSVDSPISERQARGINVRAGAFGLNVRYSVAEAIRAAREGFPSFYEAKVTRGCDHINMATMPGGTF